MLHFNPNLTEEEAINRLYAPFAPEEHEFHPFFKFAYLKEEAINRRLREVFGIAGWSKTFIGDPVYLPASEPVVEEVFAGDKRARMLLSSFAEYTEVEYEDGKVYQVTGVKEDGGKARKELKIVHDIPAVLYHGCLRINWHGHVAEYHAVGGDVLTDLGKEPGTRLMNTYKAADTDLLKRLARHIGVGLYLTEIKTAGYKIENEADLTKWLRETYGVMPLRDCKAALMEAFKGRLTGEQLGQKLRAAGLGDYDIINHRPLVIDTIERMIAAA